MKRQMRSVLAILLACNLMLNAAPAAVFAAEDEATHVNQQEAAGLDYGASLGPAYMTAHAPADDGGELLESPFGSVPVDNVTLEPVEPEAPVPAGAAKVSGLRLVSGEVVASGVCGDNLPWTLAEDDEPAQVHTQAQTVARGGPSFGAGDTAAMSVIKPGYIWNGDLEEARAAHQASSYYNMGIEGLTGTIDNLAGALSDHSALNVLKMQPDFMATCECLGIDPATADNETLANAAVFFVADQFGKLDAAGVFDAMVNDVVDESSSGSTYLNAYLTANDIDPTSKEGLFLSTALRYGIAVAFAYSPCATESERETIQNATPQGLSDAVNIIETATKADGYMTYLGEKGQDDLDAFFKFFGVLDANTDGFETISTSNLFSNPDVIAVINTILGGEGPVYVASGTCGANLTWTLDENGLLTIHGTGAMTSSPWRPGYTEYIKTVVIEDGAKNIGNFAFFNCSNLTSVTISDSVTSIGYDAFFNCSSLTSVTIPDNVTSIGYDAFQNCSNLTSVTIPDSVTSIGYAAFDDCSGLTSVTIGNSVTSIGSSAFSGCSGLTSVTIGNSVTSIGTSAFSGCSGLTSVTIPDSVTIIGSSAFSGCSGLTSVTIPDSVTSIGDYAFCNCSNLTSVTIGNSATSIGSGAFANCSITDFTVDPDNASYIFEDGVLYSKDKTLLHSCITNHSAEFIVPDSVTQIGDYAFDGCSNLTSVMIPDSVTSIGYGAFYGCNALTDVYFDGTEDEWGRIEIDSYNVSLNNTTIHFNDGSANVFVNRGTCGDNLTWTLDENGLLTIRGTGEMTSSLMWGGPWAPLYTGDIKTVVIEDGVTSIANGAFKDCYVLTSVTIPDSVTSIDDRAFWGCSSLTSATIPDSVGSIGYGAFKGCIRMESVTIPDGVASIWSSAFYGCSSLESIDLPDALTYIGKNSFSGCSSLTDVTIPYGVTKIDDYAFFNCTGLTNVEIADSVEYIGAYAFYGCNGLTDVTIPNSVTYIGEHAFPDSEQSHILYDGYVWQGDMASVAEAFNDSSFNNIGVDGLTEAVDRLAGVLSDNVAISHLRGMSRFQTTCSKLGVDPYAADRKTLANVAVFFIADMLGQLDAAAVFNAMVEDIIDGGESSHLDAYLSGEGINVASNEGLFLKTAMSFGLATAYAYAEDTAGNSYATQEEIDYLRGVMPTNLSSAVDIISSATSGDGYISYLGDLGESDLNAFFGVLGLLSENEAGFADVSVPNMFSSLEVRGAIETIINTVYPIEPSNGQCGPQLYWALDSDRTLTITGTGEMTDAPWLADHAGDISRVVIEDGAASICDDAFNGCESLVGVTIPSSVTVIGVGAFNNCSETIDIHYLGSCVEWNEVEKTDSGAINVRMDEHVFTAEPVWTWNDDLTVAIAGFTCSECGFSEDVVAEIIDHEWLEPTHTADGYRTAIALVDYHDNFYLKNEIRTLPATGHVYGDPVWNWTEEHEAAAVFTCPSDGAQQIIEAVVTTTEEPSTHTAAGALTYTALVEFNDQAYSDEVTEELPLVPHTFGEPVWTWSEDHAAFAVFACECGFEQTIPAEVTVTETVEPTHTTEGWIRYKATVVFNGDASYYDEMLQPLHTTEHVYGEPVWNWADDHTATAVFTCVNCDAQQSIPASVAIIEESPTHADAGSRVYTASVEFNGQSYTDSIAEELPVIPHSFGEPIWTWAEDHSLAAMTLACTCGYEEIVQAEVTAETLEPSHTADGWIKYTATGVFCDDTYTDEQTVVLPSADVHYNLDPFWRWADDGLSAEYVVKCAGCDVETAIEATVTEYGVRIEPTCTENGQVKYYAVARYQGTRVTDTLIVVLPASHVPGEAVQENEVPAACEAEGSYDEVVYCTVCGEELSRESTSILALGHDYVATVTEPTCTAQGYTIYTCTRCGSSMQEDEVLLGAVNTAFCAACMENMIFDLKTANGAIETTGTEGHLKIATVTASLATAADEPVVIDLTESFMKYFKGNENSEFKLFTAFVYDTVNGGFKGVLPDGSTATMSVTVNGKTYTYTQAAVDAYRSSNYNNAQLIELTNSFDNIATVLGDNKRGLAALANMATFKAELVKLGIIGEGDEITQEMLSDAALAKKVSNASVLYVAETISKMDPNQIYDAFVSGNIDTLVEGSGVDSTFVTAILQYGLLTAFVNTENGAVYKADFMEDSKNVTGLASVTNLFNKYTMNEDTGTYYDYQDYINSNAAANDIKGFLSALSFINDNAENFDLSQVYSNEDIIAAVNSILGNDGNENAVHLGSIYITDYTLALGHDYVGVVTEPTCMEQGYTTYTCSRCGDTYVANHVPSLGHDWGEWAVTTPATTAAVGEETRTCLRCSAEETRTIEPLGPEQTTVHLNIPAAVAEKIAITQNGQPIFGDAAVDSEGDVTFEVTSEQACVVLIAETNEDDETVYERIEAQETEDEGVYLFEATVEEGAEIIVAVRGDINLDGTTDLKDAMIVMQSYSQAYIPTELEVLIADFDDDVELSLKDAMIVMQIYSEAVDPANLW